MANKYNDRKAGSAGVFWILLLCIVLIAAIILIFSSASCTNADKVKEQAAILDAATATASVTPPPVKADATAAQSIVTYTAAPAVQSTEVILRTDTPSPQVTASPTPEAMANLSYGSKGEMVSQLQTRLKELGYYDGKIDGDFGSATKKAVKWFQRQAGLSADGVVGAATRNLLYSDTAEKARVTNVLGGELPLLVNRENAVDASFVPEDLVYLSDVIPDGLCIYKTSGLQGVREAVEAMARMLQAAHDDGLTVWQFTEAYRTYDRQQTIFNNQVDEYMQKNGLSRTRATEATLKTVAKPGTSEHHTGLAFDITVPGQYFVDTAQYLWMKKHCWEYGFILRYTDEKEDITGFLGEEWHYRYVGVEHALNMRDTDLCPEEYLDYLNSHK